jgi:peptidyl-prolyl cis-trans isomerase D
MFDAVRNNKRIVQVILLLITVPFALWGVDWYTRSSRGGNDVARVGDAPIGLQEFERAVREQQDRLRATLGQQFDSALLQAPEARKAVLDSMIVQRLLSLQAGRSRFATSDEQLRQFIGSVPAFQDGGRFSMERYEAAARNQGLSAVGFEARIRQDLALQQMVEPVIAGALVPGDLAGRQLSLQRETREVAEYVISPDQLAGRVKLQPDAAQKYYEANRARFEVPEQVRAEYVVLSQAALAESMSVTDEEIKRWYDTHAAQYQQAEERRASHILLSVPKDASADQRKSIRAKIEELHKQVERNPVDFERLAKEFSQDPGSAAKGGDLGFFGRGMMVKPFEEAVFALNVNQISDVVESDFGFHLIKLTGIKPARARSLEEVKAEISSDLKRQTAGRKFAEVADEFNNLVYEQSDSLKPAADRFKLAVQQSGWLIKGAKVAGELGNERLLQALFTEDGIKKKRNTEAIEVGPNTLLAARVIEHRPAQTQSFADVRASIEKQLTLDEASSLAQKEGAEKLERLVKGEGVNVAWLNPKTVTRTSVQQVEPDGLRAVFGTPADKLPRYAGAKASNGGFVLYKVIAVKAPDAAADDNRLAGVRGQLSRLYGEEEFGAYVAALRLRYPVTINASAFETTK